LRRNKILFLSVILLLVLPICHASFLSWFRGITSLATKQTAQINITLGNVPPSVLIIYIPSTVDPVDGSGAGMADVVFSFLANDQDGISQLDNNSANATFTLDAAGLGNGIQLNDTLCDAADTGNNATVQNYSCTISMRYWDKASDWSVNVSIADAASQAPASNLTFTYNSLTAINMTPSSMGWGAVTLVSTDQLSTSNPIIVGNTGNYNITSVNNSAIDLGGETTTTEFITANNFTVSIANSCVTGTTVLQNSSVGDVIIGGAGIASGLEFGEQASDELLYLCLKEVPQSISQQSYSTVNVGAWSIGIV
jgi:hypothetical protein